MLRERLTRHHLAGAGLPSPVDVVRWFGAVQAQDFTGALWAIGQRLAMAATEAEVLAAFDAGSLVRTHVLRPTWHFVAPEDLRWMLALTGPRIQAGSTARYAALGLDATTRVKAAQTFARALEGGEHLTRPQLAAALRRVRLDPGEQRLGHLLFYAELEGLICSGPRVGTQFTYALIDEWVPQVASRDRESALTTLVTRYFSSHGPATVSDASWWSGLPLGVVREGLALAGDALERRVIDGTEYWCSVDGRDTPASLQRPPGAGRRAAAVHLLPNFDEYTVAYRDRRALLHPSSEVSTLTQSTLLSQPLMVDGRHAGAWRRTVSARSTAPILVDVHLLGALTAGRQRQALVRAVDRYAAFLGRPISLRGV